MLRYPATATVEMKVDRDNPSGDCHPVGGTSLWSATAWGQDSLFKVSFCNATACSVSLEKQTRLMQGGPATKIEHLGLDLKWFNSSDIHWITYVMDRAHIRLVSLLWFTRWVWRFGLWLKYTQVWSCSWSSTLRACHFVSSDAEGFSVLLDLKERPDMTDKQRRMGCQPTFPDVAHHEVKIRHIEHKQLSSVF